MLQQFEKALEKCLSTYTSADVEVFVSSPTGINGAKLWEHHQYGVHEGILIPNCELCKVTLVSPKQNM